MRSRRTGSDAGARRDTHEPQEAVPALAGGRACCEAPGKGRKRATGSRAPLTVPSRPSERWSLDFVSDVFVESRRLRILAVIDDYTREGLCLVADRSLSGERVAREPDRLIRLYGKPDTVVSNNGTERTSRALPGMAE